MAGLIAASPRAVTINAATAPLSSPPPPPTNLWTHGEPFFTYGVQPNLPQLVFGEKVQVTYKNNMVTTFLGLRVPKNLEMLFIYEGAEALLLPCDSMFVPEDCITPPVT